MVLDGHMLGIPRGQMTADSEPGTGSGSVGGLFLLKGSCFSLLSPPAGQKVVL